MEVWMCGGVEVWRCGGVGGPAGYDDAVYLKTRAPSGSRSFTTGATVGGEGAVGGDMALVVARWDTVTG